MEKIKTVCMYCGLMDDMEVKDRYYIDGQPGRLYEIECPRCHRLFGRQIADGKGGLQNGGNEAGA